MLGMTVSLVVSTVYLRYHYVIDVIAGVLLAMLCLGVTFWLYREQGEGYAALLLSNFLRRSSARESALTILSSVKGLEMTSSAPSIP